MNSVYNFLSGIDGTGSTQFHVKWRRTISIIVQIRFKIFKWHGIMYTFDALKFILDHDMVRIYFNEMERKLEDTLSFFF
jgi:hypothetical protein